MIAVEMMTGRRTPAKHKARQLATSLRRERPDYAYLKKLFRQAPCRVGDHRSTDTQAPAVCTKRGRDPSLLRDGLENAQARRPGAHQDLAVHRRTRQRAGGCPTG